MSALKKYLKAQNNKKEKAENPENFRKNMMKRIKNQGA